MQTTRLTGTAKDRLRERFQSAFGRIDLYALFIERALELLPPGGVLAFVTPDKFLAGESMAALRTLVMERAAVRRVSRFRSHKVFADAATVPCVTVLERGARSTTIEVSECAHAPGEVTVVQSARVAAEGRLRPDGWNVLQPDLLEVAERLRGSHPVLESLSQRISAGYATGRDRLFLFASDDEVPVEPELLRDALRGRDIERFHPSAPRLKLLLPYEFASDGSARLIDLARFPRTRRYLERFRPELEARHCVRVWEKAWYDVHDPVGFDLARTPKIVVPDVALTSRFAFDPGHCAVLHSAYYVVPDLEVDPWFLTGLLNTKPIEFLIHLTAPVVKDGFRRYRRQFLAKLPIPDAPSRVRRRIARDAQRGDQAALERAAAQLFGLSSSDLAVIERH